MLWGGLQGGGNFYKDWVRVVDSKERATLEVTGGVTRKPWNGPDFYVKAD